MLQEGSTRMAEQIVTLKLTLDEANEVREAVRERHDTLRDQIIRLHADKQEPNEALKTSFGATESVLHRKLGR